MTQPSTPVSPPEDRRYVETTEFFRALHEAGLLPEYPMVSRVVIDCDGSQGTSIVRMYVDRIPGSALLEIPALMTVPDPTVAAEAPIVDVTPPYMGEAHPV